MSDIIATFELASRRYGATKALTDFNLELRRGELTALLGANGAGKTTAVRLLLGLLPPSSGRVLVLGRDPLLPSTRACLGTMLQVGRVPETLRVREHIELFSSYYDDPLPLEESVALSGLAGLESRPFGKLSGGQKQRVLFALAICGNPQLLLLDEPTVGLDVEARRLMWEQVRRLVSRGTSVLLTTHYLDEADALADRVAVVHQGRLVACGPASEIKSAASGKVIRCRSAMDANTIARIGQVHSVREDRGRWEILTGSPETVLRTLLELDPSVDDLEVVPARLEEAFLALTKQEAA